MTSPFDFLKPGTEYASKELAEQRLEICNACEDSMTVPMRVCKHCGCVCSLKVKLAESECPIGKW